MEDIRELKELVAKQPKNPNGWRALGEVYLKSKQVSLAVETFGELVKLSPKDPDAWHLLGTACFAQGNNIRAKDAFQKAKDLGFQEKDLRNRTLETATLAKFQKLIQVSRRLKISQIGEYLDLPPKEIFNRLVDWAATFGFKIDGDEVDFEGGRKEDFIVELERSFSQWGMEKAKKV